MADTDSDPDVHRTDSNSRGALPMPPIVTVDDGTVSDTEEVQNGNDYGDDEFEVNVR